MTAIIGVIGTLVGALIAGYFTSRREKSQREYERTREKRVLLLEKYEAIFKELGEYEAMGAEIAMQMLSEVGYNGKFDASKLKTNLRENKLTMNVTFYAPEIKADVDKMLSHHLMISKSLTEFIVGGNGSSEEKEKHMGIAGKAAIELSESAKEIRTKLAKLADSQVNA